MDEVKYKVESIWGQVTVSPCPFCSQKFRHPRRNDPRGPITLYGDRYHCFECDQSGKRSDLKNLEVTEELDKESRTKKVFMDPERVSRFWNYCTTISPSSDVHKYLEGRFGRRDFCVPPHLARRFPDFAHETEEIKGWKRRRKLIFPAHDSEGQMRNFIARSLAAKPRIKSVSLSGFKRSSLSMQRLGAPQKVIICEGELDWLAWCLFGPENTTVYGIYSGSLTSNDCFLDNHRFAEVLIATDMDSMGDEYAEKIVKRLHYTCETKRWVPPVKKANDACDVIKKGGNLEWEGFL